MVQPTGTAQQHAPRLGTRSGSRSVFATRSPRMLLPRATAIPPCSPSSRSTKWGLAHDQLWFSEHLPAHPVRPGHLQRCSSTPAAQCHGGSTDT